MSNNMKEMRKTLENLINDKGEARISYTDKKGQRTVRTIRPEDFTNGASGPQVIAVDVEKGQYRRFSLNSISNLTV